MNFLQSIGLAIALFFAVTYSTVAQSSGPLKSVTDSTSVDSLMSPAALPVVGPSIQFEEEKHDFGQIKQGDIVEHTFTFKNNGTMPLVISNVRTTCGCTATDYPKAPVMPGEKATISARFNSAGKKGAQNKVITVDSNAVQGSTQVMIITTILAAK